MTLDRPLVGRSGEDRLTTHFLLILFRKKGYKFLQSPCQMFLRYELLKIPYRTSDLSGTAYLGTSWWGDMSGLKQRLVQFPTTAHSPSFGSEWSQTDALPPNFGPSPVFKLLDLTTISRPVRQETRLRLKLLSFPLRVQARRNQRQMEHPHAELACNSRSGCRPRWLESSGF